MQTTLDSAPAATPQAPAKDWNSPQKYTRAIELSAYLYMLTELKDKIYADRFSNPLFLGETYNELWACLHKRAKELQGYYNRRTHRFVSID